MRAFWRSASHPLGARPLVGTRAIGSRQWAVGIIHGVIFALVPIAYCLLPLAASADVLDDLRDRLAESRQKLQAIEAKVDEYRARVQEQQAEATTLRGQIVLIDRQVDALTLELDKTSVEIEKVEDESAVVGEELRRAEEDVHRKRGQLKESLRILQTLSADSVVETFFKYPSLSGAITEVRALERVQQKMQETLGVIKELRAALRVKATVLADLERELKELKERQTRQKQTMEAQQVAKQRLFEVTKEQEAKFQDLLEQTAVEQRRANAQIAQIEAGVRAELARLGIARLGGVGTFDWPIDPSFGITCGFHCPDYPYRHLLGPHTGIDIPANIGTTIRAVADGYVARAHDAGGPGYSYVLLLHGDDFSTVYGHLSSISVSDGQFINRGQPIGGTGGAPGMHGAGLSTGPHLHFEVRQNGIPTDPARYLP